jgi:di/tricarboxylate transporter
MLSFEIIIVFSVVLFILVSLYKELFGPSFTFLIGIVVLGLTGILSPKEILSGFANEQVAVVIMLLLVSDVIQRTGVIEIYLNRFFYTARTYKSFLGRMTIAISVVSSVFNDTPLVAIMIPYVTNWSRRNNVSPSKLLIPLSYAAIIGGCATLIGTSTNLVLSGMVTEQHIITNLRPLRFFDFSIVGFTMVAIGSVYIRYFGPKLLPSRPDPLADIKAQSRGYVVEARVKEKSDLIGKEITTCSSINSQGLNIAEIIRDSVHICPIPDDIHLQKDDILIFEGETADIAELINNEKGLTLSEIGMLRKKDRAEVIEIVVSVNSTLINKSVKEINFRSRFDAAIIAVHRNGVRLTEKISEVVLRAGDVLLCFAGEDFVKRTSDIHDFYFISKVRNYIKYEPYKLAVLFGGMALAIILSAMKIIPLFMGTLIILMAALSMKIVSPKELPKAIDYNLAIIIVLSLAFGTAMIKTGAARLIADNLIHLCMPLGKVGILAALYFITALLAAMITTKASLALIFPISLTTSVNLGLNPMPFILVVGFASAANFMTPIGFQTNLMVFGPGGYTFRDFFRFGLPLTILYMIVAISLLSFIYF